ncbi:AraC family transcriptional regulator [Pectobacterium versatile]|uniref:AraC family transcriptional regulator n=1 Tax=Pectobacterium versatile TaxID=2488639 RepID=UPI001B37DBCA|nr:AraC family transcriptional regulator [Pectobacterium versatile]MBQ4777024.1 helix-turn-helix domain-containing protein [Pectobacterium versatile]
MQSQQREWMKFVAVPSLGIQGLHAYFNKHQYERHSHDYFVLGTIDVGAPKVALEKGGFIAPPGSAMIINPGEMHDGKPCDDQGYIYSMVYIDPWMINDLAQAHDVSVSSPTRFTRSLIMDADIVFLLKKLHRVLFSEQDPLVREISMIDALNPLFQRYSTTPVKPQPVRNEPRIERVRELIHACFSEPLTTSVLAEAAALSRVRLNQLFSAAYGLPLHAYLNAVRLDAAKQLLRSGHCAADVAAFVGLSDQSHLIRRFKGTFGITPAQYTAAYLSDVQYTS